MSSELQSERDIGRLNAFTDGIIVVSMTLLILDVRLPETLGDLDGAKLLHGLAELWPKLFGYIVSFLVIAQYWMGYTDRFGRMQRADNGFAWLNILLLLVIGFIPFVTALLGRNHGAVATALYAGTMVCISMLLVVMWLYAARKGLLEAPGSAGAQWRAVAPWLQIAAVFGLSIAVALFNARIAKLTWLLLLVPAFTFSVSRLGKSSGRAP
jgi:uncharacterized membrane protein